MITASSPEPPLRLTEPAGNAGPEAWEEPRFAAAMENFLLPLRDAETVERAMRVLMAASLAALPLPGGGRTLARWQALAAVGACDLSLAKIFESHTDALAILAELRGNPAEGLWAVWAAEAPEARVTFRTDGSDGTLTGRKAWCSGAGLVDHAVISAWTEGGEPMLARVALRQAEVSIDLGGWHNAGMAAAGNGTVTFSGARAEALGAPGAYVARPGFGQGGAGVAAVWYGGAVAIAELLAGSSRIPGEPHAAAHLGALDTALSGARALLREAAAWIDAHPFADASGAALRVRASVEAAAGEALARTGRALGPGPLCRQAAHAQRCSDLTLFLRQTHAEHDLAALGRQLAHDPTPWRL